MIAQITATGVAVGKAMAKIDVNYKLSYPGKCSNKSADHSPARPMERKVGRAVHFGINNKEVAVRTMNALVLVGLLAVSPLGMAQSAFNGTWRPNPQTFSPTRKPDVVELVSGVYDCQTCVPPYKIKADGEDQAIWGIWS